MIDISKLTEADKGRGVVYRAASGDKGEDGVISSWNERYIFVRYSISGVAATLPEDLEFLYHPSLAT